MTGPTISRAARDLQSAANRLALMTRNHNRDVILAGLFPDVVKGQRAAKRLEVQGPEIKALEDQVRALRIELGGMLDRLVKVDLLPHQTDLIAQLLTEPPTKKRKKSK